mgnify:CR=1 FL=1
MQVIITLVVCIGFMIAGFTLFIDGNDYENQSVLSAVLPHDQTCVDVPFMNSGCTR